MMLFIFCLQFLDDCTESSLQVKFELMDETVQLKRHSTCDRFAIGLFIFLC